MTFVLVLCVVAAVGAGGWYGWRRSRKPGPGRVAAKVETMVLAPQVAEPERHPGRMINPGKECCAAVRKIESAWYPEGKVPRLPLETCEHPQQCDCGWMRVLDRRATHRRTEHDRRDQMRFEDKSDRRTGTDRRGNVGNPWKNN